MKYLVLSDIHGSFYYFNEVINKESFDKLILLGDVLPHGPRNDLPKDYAPKKIIPVLNSIKDKIICIKGNCDAEVDEMVFEFPIVNMAVLDLNGKNIYFTHGHIYNKSNPLNVANSIVVYGHTHVKDISNVDSNIYINPGSLSIPKDGTNSYMVIEDGTITVKLIDGTKYGSVKL